MNIYRLVFLAAFAAFGFSGLAQTANTLVINEADVDTPGFDDEEFIELYGEPNGSLDGIVLVLYRGNNNTVYAAYDLTGFALNNEGFFVAGNALVPEATLLIGDNVIRNGSDAIALYTGALADFPLGAAVTTENLIDALVYATNDPPAPGLMSLLLDGEPMVNESANGNPSNESMSRVPDGGAQRVTSTYVTQAPTPGTFNIVNCDGGALSLAPEIPTPAIACTDIPDQPINFLVNGSEPTGNYLLLVTNLVNQIIAVEESPAIDFFGYTNAQVRVWGLAYTGTLVPSTLTPGLPITGIQSDDCAVLSNAFVTVDLITCIPPECLGGNITVNGATTTQVVCWNGESPVLEFATDSEYAATYVWALTSLNGSILATSEVPSFDLSTYGSGFMRVYGISYTGTLDAGSFQPGFPIAAVSSDDCFSVSSNNVQINSLFCAITEGCTDLFISEYLEGTGNNKALEIYNPTQEPINLGPYRLECYNDGSLTPVNSLNLQGIIQPGQAYVIGNSNGNAAIIAASDVLSNVTFFNGNDPIVLRKDGAIIDIMGIIGPEADPLEPNGFIVADGAGSMDDHTLVRKANINQGSLNWLTGQAEWDVYPNNTTSFLGSHTTTGCSLPENPTMTFTNATITVVQGQTALIGVGLDLPVDVNACEVVLVGGTAIPGVNFDNLFPVTINFPEDEFDPQLLSMATFVAPALDAPVTVQLQIVPTTDASTFIEFLTITILPLQDPPSAPILPILDVHGESEPEFLAVSEGLLCELRGVVHGVNLTQGGLLFTLIDPTGGIAVYHPDQNFGYTVQEGDSLHVIGVIDQFEGLTRIVPVFITEVSQNNDLMVPELTATLGEHTESLVWEFKCVELLDPSQWVNIGDFFDVDISLGLGDVKMRIYATTDIFGTAPPEGVFTFQAIGSQADPEAPFDDNYFVVPQYLSTFTPGVSAAFEVDGGLEQGIPFSPDNTSLGGSSFQWNFGDGTVLNDENPEHTYLVAGEYTITLTVFDATGTCSDQFSITVQVDPVGVTEVAEMKLNLYPNPANEQVTIEAQRALETLRIYDLTGRTVFVAENIGSPRTTINVAAFTAGVYFVEANGVRVRLVVN